MLDGGKAYKCFCTKEELEAKREAALAAKKDIKYDGTCRNLSLEEVQAKEDAGTPFVIRFKTPQQEGIVSFEDKVLGNTGRAYSDIEDFTIVRSNGKPLYMLCNVIDDIRDRISHVIRGQDHLTNTPRQVLLYEALEAPVPVFAHMPLTLDLQKKKISKRSHGEIVAVQFYRKQGFIPWALVNFLVLLGWSPGTDQEIFSQEELIESFTLERINKSNSIFNHRIGDEKFFTDPKALNINGHYIRTMDLGKLGELVKAELSAEGLWDDSYDGDQKDWYLKTLDMIRERFFTIKDFSTLGRDYFSDEFDIDPKALKKNLLKHPQLEEWLPMLADRFDTLDELTAEAAEHIAREFAQELEIKPGIPINGSRAILTGQIKGPSMFELYALLGKEKVVRRLKNTARFFQES